MRAWACLGLVVLLAGCVAEPPVWTNDVAPMAPSEGGTGPRTLRVHATDGQAAMPAAVLLVWQQDPEAPPAADPFVLLQLGLRTANGTVTGHVPNDRVVYALVGAGDAWTEEWTRVQAGADATDLTVRLFHRGPYPFAIEKSWQGAAVGFDAWPYAEHAEWDPSPLVLSPDEQVNAALQARLGSLEGTLKWENTPTAMGDLGVIAATRGGASACAIHDDERDLALGAATQEFRMPYDSHCTFFGPNTITSIALPIDIGPATRSHMAAPLGLPYTIEGSGSLLASYGWQALADEFGERPYSRVWVNPETGAAEKPVAGHYSGWAVAGLAGVLLALALRRRA
ncbi:MAG: hypothetical protein QOD77_738 [Thermoplasmata archaeon]|jgi:hypothetical protein|nr:hypothetical protein [Thermoplasmata archaeon]